MGQVLHRNARTTEQCVGRYSIVVSLRVLAKRYGLSYRTLISTLVLAAELTSDPEPDLAGL
jgi:hypothetical protein